MTSLLRISLLTAFLSLTACGTAQVLTATAAPSALPTTPAPATPSGIPSATPTESPTPVATPGILELKNDAMKSQIDRLAESFLAPGNSSALGVAVVIRNAQTGGLEAMLLDYGASSKSHGQFISSDTMYEIGSITKVFTGILLAESVTSGTVGLNDPIQKYMPPGIQAPSYRDLPITLDQLATHHSSLPRDIDTDSLPALYGWLDKYQLARAPGSQYAYSNVGYSLLGDILARLSGTDFGTLEFQSISLPLGLLDTRESLTSDQTNRLAQGYNYDGSAADYFPDDGAMSGAGYLRSTLTDMTRFLVANMRPDSTPLSASIRLAQAVQAQGKNPTTGIGLAWDVEQPGTSHERLSKGGGTSGFSSYISFMADGSSGFVLLNNGRYAETLVPSMLGILTAN